MQNITYQPELRPVLPVIDGPKEYRQQRDLLIRIDEILALSGIEKEAVILSLEHQQIDCDKLSPKQFENIARNSILALRTNIARHLFQMSHRDFCIRLADSPLLQHFLQIGKIDGIKTFAKSTSSRFSKILGADQLHLLNAKLIALLKENATPNQRGDFNLRTPIKFDDVYFDSTCLKAPIHFPVDWVLLRDAVRTLMKAILLIRRRGLLNRMPQEPLDFLSDINTLCMKMTAKNRTKEGKKHRKKVLREMKALLLRASKHALKHLKILQERGMETDFSPGEIKLISRRMQGVLEKLPDAIKQAHERIIGERKYPNQKKILSLYDPDAQVINRGKVNGEVEFGNNLWLGETREGLIVDYLLEKQKTVDSKQVEPAMQRLIFEQNLPVKNVWGDRGLHSAQNEKLLGFLNIRSGLCPRNVVELRDRLKKEPGMREGLKRRAGMEARISIIIRNFMGCPARSKGFKHRENMVGWAVLSHNLWVIARLEQAAKPEQQLPMVA